MELGVSARPATDRRREDEEDGRERDASIAAGGRFRDLICFPLRKDPRRERVERRSATVAENAFVSHGCVNAEDREATTTACAA